MADKILKEKRRLFIQSVEAGTINGLLDELLEKRVLNQEEMEKVRAENATVMDKARALTDSVIKKGPMACQIFITHICKDDCYLAGTLGLSSGKSPQEMKSHQVELTSSGPGGGLKLCPLEAAQRIWKEKSTEIYPIMARMTRTRLALIICNTEFDSLPRRAGADVDVRDMKMLLENLGYRVDVKENITASDMATELKAFAARPEHQTSDSTFLVFMSHGIRDGICGTKYSEKVSDVLEVNTIFQMLNTWNCPSLKDKPKVIIIQESSNTDLCTLVISSYDGRKKAHVEKDFIAFCSSTPDNVSWRHPILGSLFIMKLIKNIQEYAWSCDLEEIFRKVRFSFELPDGRAQMPTTERVTLTRCFYLFPGH
uniref:Caspase-1 n=1 Tax=Spermophilus dauricus TaxID=99837 RepID=A0A8C9QPK5_SPEDA